MERLHYVLVLLLIVASLIFGGVLAYSNNKAKELSFFVDSINTLKGFDAEKKRNYEIDHREFSQQQLYLEPVGLTITEKRSVFAFMTLAIFIYCLVCFLAIKERVNKGPNTFQIPLVFTSILLSATFIIQSITMGVP